MDSRIHNRKRLVFNWPHLIGNDPPAIRHFYGPIISLREREGGGGKKRHNVLSAVNSATYQKHEFRLG